ncbi:DUF1304 domain-containing protein [Rhodobacter sp. NTK016B]|uniref:DUF1304 domain-containing protein n=1 Tax=Rhodobacter sp. NTK016B TaxID=2759676 RepID=UPI00257080E6|nr:DUF1304 domain-containing protein [Rhodobacter sp. NTK016B]
MSLIAMILVALIALLHLYILWLEMFAWETRGPAAFRSLPRELFPQTKTLAANQGLYNGFLAAGLIWSLFIADPDWARNVATCFLLFVLVAGAYGALTASRRIFLVQGVPALLALAAVWLL